MVILNINFNGKNIMDNIIPLKNHYIEYLKYRLLNLIMILSD